MMKIESYPPSCLESQPFPPPPLRPRTPRPSWRGRAPTTPTPPPPLPPAPPAPVGARPPPVTPPPPRRYPGETGARQPVHTVYGGAQLFAADTVPKLGQLALRAMNEYAPDAESLAEAIG